MHKILHILGTAIHFLWGLNTMLIMHTDMLRFMLENEGSNDTADVFKIMKPVKLNYGYGA